MDQGKEELVQVYVTDDPVEQSVVLNLLKNNGIRGVLNNVLSQQVVGLGNLGYNPAAGAVQVLVQSGDAEWAGHLLDEYLDSTDAWQMAQEESAEIWDESPDTDRSVIDDHQKMFNRRLVVGMFCLFIPVLQLGPALSLYQLRLAWRVAEESRCSLRGWVWFWLLGILAVPLLLVFGFLSLALVGSMLGIV